MYIRLLAQLEKDRSGSARQVWMETSGSCPADGPLGTRTHQSSHDVAKNCSFRQLIAVSRFLSASAFESNV